MCIQTTVSTKPIAVAASIGTSFAIPLRSSRKVDDVDIDALCASFEDLSLSDKPEDMEIDDPMDVDAIFDDEPQDMEIDEYFGPLIDPPQDMEVDAFFPPLLTFGVEYMEVDAVFGPQLASSRRN